MNRTLYQVHDAVDTAVVQAGGAGLRRRGAAVHPDRRVATSSTTSTTCSRRSTASCRASSTRPATTSAASMLNTGFGLGGLFDLASMIGIERGNEDFGQTFGVWGFPQGPYLFVPLFGPTTVRDGTGVDRALRARPRRLHSRRAGAQFSCTASATSTFARRRSTRATSSTRPRSTATRSSATPICSGAAISSTTASRRPNPRRSMMSHSTRSRLATRGARRDPGAALVRRCASACAQEAPDAMVKRVATDVIAIDQVRSRRSRPATRRGSAK